MIFYPLPVNALLCYFLACCFEMLDAEPVVAIPVPAPLF